jgi:predicted nucleic acid-binding protein
MPPVVVDTNIMIRAIRGEERVMRWLNSVNGDPIFPCFIVMELIASCTKKEDRAVLQRNVIDRYGIYWPNPNVIKRAYELVRDNQNLARRLKVIDALIAACAMELHAKLYTNDNDFANIPGLKKYRPEILP